MDIKELKSHLDSANAEMKSLVERQSDELKNVGKVSNETATELKAAEKRLAETSADLDARMVEVEKQMGRPGSAGNTEVVKSAGQQFVESKQYTEAKDRRATSVDAVEVKDITSAAGSAGAVSVSQRVPGIFRDPADRRIHIRDLMNISNTNSGSIEYYVDHSGFTNNAGPQVAELAAKAKSDLVLEAKTTSVKTIAHHVIASRQVLEDAPMLQGYIDGRLRYGLELNEDAQLIYGDGTGGTMVGIFNTAGVQDQGTRAATDDYVAHLRKAMTKARLSNYEVTGLIINPVDWEKIELLQDADGNYIWLQYMSQNGESKLFRVPVIETNAINEGDFLLGDFGMAATLWVRDNVNIRVTDSHANLFIENGVAILGEKRVALTVERPSAFVKGSFVETVVTP